MEVKGKITHVLPETTGMSAKGVWVKQNFVLIEIEGQYPKSIAFDAFNKDWSLKVGDVVNVSLNVESKEFNGKWYTNLSGYKIEIFSSEAKYETKTTSTTSEPEPEPETDDSPF